MRKHILLGDGLAPSFGKRSLYKFSIQRFWIVCFVCLFKPSSGGKFHLRCCRRGFDIFASTGGQATHTSTYDMNLLRLCWCRVSRVTFSVRGNFSRCFPFPSEITREGCSFLCRHGKRDGSGGRAFLVFGRGVDACLRVCRVFPKRCQQQCCTVVCSSVRTGESVSR